MAAKLSKSGETVFVTFARMKIIVKGEPQPKRHGRCVSCKCVFEFDRNDLWPNVNNRYDERMRCPNCGRDQFDFDFERAFEDWEKIEAMFGRSAIQAPEPALVHIAIDNEGRIHGASLGKGVALDLANTAQAQLGMEGSRKTVTVTAVELTAS